MAGIESELEAEHGARETRWGKPSKRRREPRRAIGDSGDNTKDADWSATSGSRHADHARRGTERFEQ